MNNRRCEIERKRYLASLGEEIPVDYNHFKLGNQKQDLCIFCEDPHDGIELLQYTWSRSGEGTETYLCAECNQHVETMLREDNNDEYSSFADKGFEPKERINPADTALSDENKKITDLLANLKFSEDVYKYYRHVNPNEDSYVDNQQSDRCYICSKIDRGSRANAYAKPPWGTIQVPIDVSNIMVGGHLWICVDCEKRVSERFGDKLESIYSHHMLLQNIERLTCPICRQYYYITKEEADSRKGFSELQYMCSECAYDATVMQAEHWLFSYEAIPPRTAPLERWIGRTCKVCKEVFFVDAFATHESLERYHLVGSTCYCTSCVKNGIKKALEGELIFNHHDMVYIRLRADNKYWKYKIIRLIPKESKFENLQSGSLNVSNIALAVSIAFKEVDRLFYGEQSELEL